MNAPVLQVPDRTTTASVVGGVPLATLTVWLVQRYGLRPDEMLDPTVAVALGSLGAAVFGEVWHILHRLLNRVLPPDPPTEEPAP